MSKEEKENIDTLTINKDYKERFQHNKKRQLIEKGKFVRDRKEESESESDSSEDVSEDSEGELDNDIVRDKFIDTLLKLKDENETKKLLQEKTPIFTDEDFKKKREKINKEKEDKDKKAYTINDALMENNDDENDIYSVNYKPKVIEEDHKEKDEFIKVANEEENNDDNDGDFFDDGFIKVKKSPTLPPLKTEDSKEAKDEESDLDEETVKKMTIEEALKKSKIKTKNEKLLKKVWGDDAKLSEEDRFLRNYILSEGWLEKNKNKFDNRQFLQIDKSDEENDSKFDEFENKFNHRFEEEGGANITTYKRDIDSYRHKDDSRALKRKEREKRKEEEKKQIIAEETKKNKEKMNEIKEKLNKLEKIAGTKKIKELYEELEKDDKDFDMDKFDKKMNDIFNDEYYNKKINEEEAEEENEEKEEEEEEENNDEDNHLWFYCDNCKKPLKPGKIKYECKTCEDYTLCKSCFKTLNHSHTMKKEKVSVECVPPENAEELIAKMTAETELKCSRCGDEIVNNYYFICENEECSSLKFCKKCRGIGKSIHEHKLHKFVMKTEEEDSDEEEKLNPKEKIEKLIEEKTMKNVDDVIDGNIKTKFHYTKVAKDDNDLTNEMLVLLDDKVLNKYIPVKKIAPYSDFKLPDYKKKSMLKHLEKLVEKKKSEMAEEFKKKKTTEQENEKILGNKTKRNKDESKSKNLGLNKSEFKKKKRLETYGITDNE